MDERWVHRAPPSLGPPLDPMGPSKRHDEQGGDDRHPLHFVAVDVGRHGLDCVAEPSTLTNTTHQKVGGGGNL